jgi:hypothetical protein
VLAPVMMDLKNLRLGSVGLDRLSWLALDRLGWPVLDRLGWLVWGLVF